MSNEIHACDTIIGLDVASFYGVKNKTVSTDSDVNEGKLTYKHGKPLKGLPHRLNNLLGPSQVWKVFKKQSEALEFAKKLRSGLQTFAFQQSDGQRLFLVAHPKVFWHYDIQKSVHHRCAYEVIPESTVCKLYFDIEFDIHYNKGKDGPLTVDTFIIVVLYFLSKLFHINVDKDKVLNLDSSTDDKFSRHLIFQLGSHAFSNNKSVGDFVCFICKKLELYLEYYESEEYFECDGAKSKESTDICGCCKTADSTIYGCFKQIGLSRDTLKNLMVFDRKGNKRLICDLSVYSKNRHFRLFHNTKWGKQSPLEISKDNSYWPEISKGKKVYKPDCVIFNETVFLDSLITYFSNFEENVDDVKVVDFKTHFMLDYKITGNKVYVPKTLQTYSKLNYEIPTSESPYPTVDKFINSLVYPGQIWKKTYFSTTSVIVYDIVGNRYCHNIKRPHQSNNVKYIINLKTYIYYQKCHDPECSSFRSEPHQLPPELKFQLEDDLFDSNDIDTALRDVESSDSMSETDLVEAASVVEDLSAIVSDEEV